MRSQDGGKKTQQPFLHINGHGAMCLNACKKETIYYRVPFLLLIIATLVAPTKNIIILSMKSIIKLSVKQTSKSISTPGWNMNDYYSYDDDYDYDMGSPTTPCSMRNYMLIHNYIKLLLGNFDAYSVNESSSICCMMMVLVYQITIDVF